MIIEFAKLQEVFKTNKIGEGYSKNVYNYSPRNVLKMDKDPWHFYNSNRVALTEELFPFDNSFRLVTDEEALKLFELVKKDTSPSIQTLFEYVYYLKKKETDPFLAKITSPLYFYNDRFCFLQEKFTILPTDRGLFTYQVAVSKRHGIVRENNKTGYPTDTIRSFCTMLSLYGNCSTKRVYKETLLLLNEFKRLGHTDCSMDNIGITSKGEVKLIDYGFRRYESDWNI